MNSIIDWELSTKLANNNPTLAKELLLLLTKDLHIELDEITKYFIDHNHHEMKRRLHRLHGALNYCGVPRLKSATIALENAVNEQQLVDLPLLLDEFGKAVKELTRWVTLTSQARSMDWFDK